MSVVASIRSQLAPINREGYPFVGAFALASLILFWLWTPLGWIGTVLTAWCAYFFRDPVRVTPTREGLVVAPADGRVSKIIHAVPPAELGLGDRPLPRVSIFMSVFNCHVNRSPVSGRIEQDRLQEGRLHQRRSRQGERGQRAQFLRHRLRERPHRRHPDRRAGRAAHRLFHAPRRERRGRRAHRHDSVRVARGRLSAGRVRPLVAEGQTAIAGETVIAELRGRRLGS